MASSEFDVDLFEKKLQGLKDSQESIQSLSAWCLERRSHHKKIVATWLQVLKKVKVEHRLTLFYLANDVIQYSKRKNFEFVESWGTTLQRATTMVREEKVKHRILRIFKIWEQRQIYDEEFLSDLSGLLSAAPKKKQEQVTSEPDEFQANILISTMRSCATLEQTTDARLRDLRDTKFDLDNVDEIRTTLKDRSFVEDVEREVDTAVKSVECYVKALETEIKERTLVVDLLEQADQFYETQRSEVKIVANAYRNFGSRVKNLKKKLDELIPMLTSPLPSPDVNAPSPSPDSDIELPGEESTINQSSIIEVAPPSLYGSYAQEYEQSITSDQTHSNTASDFTPNFSSFMGGNMDFDMRNLFNDRTSDSQYGSLEAKPIDRIHPHDSSNDNFNSTGFINSVDRVPNLGIPGLGLDTGDNSTLQSPPRGDYRPHSGTPLGPRMANQGSQMSHSTPLAMRNLNADRHPPYSNHNNQTNFENSSVTPLPPPPLPPLPIFLEDDNCYNKLPPKFPTWTAANDMPNESKWNDKRKHNMNQPWSGDVDNQWDQGNNSNWNSGMRNKNLSETPESPPLYEKSGFTNPVEYNDSQEQDPLLGSVGDVDHRVLQVPLPLENLSHRVAKAADVDHRNLISLTGSPANNSSTNDSTSANINDNLWTNTDQDYRRHVQPGDNVESVDMDMSLSDEEGENKQKGRGILVDVRHQDREVPNQEARRLDMDMRMIPLPSGASGPPTHNLAPPLPPPPMPPFQSEFRQPNVPFPHDGPNNFRPNESNNYHPNQMPPFQPPNFGPNQPNYQDYNFHDKHERYPESMDDKRGRLLQRPDHGFRDRESYQWNDRPSRGRGGRGRGRFQEDHQNNQKQWTSPNNRRGRGGANRPEVPPKFGDPNANALEPPEKPHPDEIDFTNDTTGSDCEPELIQQIDANSVCEPPKQLSEELEAMMKQHDELLDDPLELPNGPQFESLQHNFRQRAPIWRGSPGLRARAGFRGSPRGMWENRGPRMPPINSVGFSPRGPGRGNRAGFRGRGARW